MAKFTHTVLMKQLFVIVLISLIINHSGYSQSSQPFYYGSDYKVLKAFAGSREDAINFDIDKMQDVDIIVTLLYKAENNVGKLYKVIVQNERKIVLNFNRTDSIKKAGETGYMYYNIGKDEEGGDIEEYDFIALLDNADLRKIHTNHNRLKCIVLLRRAAGVVYLCEELKP